jgi:hypothetical protein
MNMVCRSINSVMSGSERGRGLWLNLGVSATASGPDGYDPADIHRRFAHLKGKTEFFWNLELLVCPWSANGIRLPVDVGGANDTDMSLWISNEDEGRLNFISCEVNGARVQRLSFPSAPCEEFGDRIHALGSAVVAPDMNQLSSTMEILSIRADAKEIVPDYSHDGSCKHRVYPIHSGSFAVVEFFLSGMFDDNEIIDHGVYFFSHVDGRLLRHILINSEVYRADCVIVSKPCEMWILAHEGIRYFGPSCERRGFVPAEYMDPALWAIARGDVETAIAHMNRIGAPLECRGLISKRTLLHYAAKEGHLDAVRRLLLSENFGAVDYLDLWGHSALYLAVAELRLDVVELLLEVGKAKIVTGTCIFNDIGGFCRYRPYAKCPERAKLEFDHLMPSITKLILEKCPTVIDSSEGVCCYRPILSSPKTVRLLVSAGDDTNMNWVAAGCSAGVGGCIGFRTREHALSAISTLGVLVSEFNMDINSKEFDFNEFPLVYLASNAIADAFISAVETLGADTSVKNNIGQSIREIIAGRAFGVGDAEGLRMLSFLDSREL